LPIPQATKKLTGGSAMRRRVTGADRKDSTAAALAGSAAAGDSHLLDNVVRIFFEPAHYTVFENVGEFAVSICRDGPLDCQVIVHVQTEDGTANAETDYIPIDTQLVFAPGEERKEVSDRRDCIIHIQLIELIGSRYDCEECVSRAWKRT
jgi:solute carrier family 8 (sodium/calcium exchanger)